MYYKEQDKSEKFDTKVDYVFHAIGTECDHNLSWSLASYKTKMRKWKCYSFKRRVLVSSTKLWHSFLYNSALITFNKFEQIFYDNFMSFMKLKIFILLFITFSDLFTFVFHFIIGFWLYAYSLIGPFLLLFYYLFLYMYIFWNPLLFFLFISLTLTLIEILSFYCSYCPFPILNNRDIQKI